MYKRISGEVFEEADVVMKTEGMFPPRHPGVIDSLMFRTKLQVVKSLVQLGHTLDVGCGDKKYTVYLPNPVGIDAYRECDHIHADPDVWMDALDLKFPDNSFDNVCFFDVLEHIPEVDVAIKEAWRVLRPNGVLAIIDPSDTGLFVSRLLCGRIRQAFRGTRTPHTETQSCPGHIHHFNKDRLLKITGSLFRLEKVIPRIIFTGYKFRRIEQ